MQKKKNGVRKLRNGLQKEDVIGKIKEKSKSKRIEMKIFAVRERFQY